MHYYYLGAFNMKSGKQKINKIVFLLPFLEGRGGLETVMNLVIPMIESDDIQVKLFMLGKEEQHNKEWLEGVDYSYSMCTHKSKKIRALVYITALIKYLYKEKPDIVICTNSLTCSMGYIARKITFGKYPIVSWCHNSLTDSYVKKNIIQADFHLAIATGIKEQLYQLGANKSNIYIIFNPCKPVNKQLARSIGKKKFAYCGRIVFDHEKKLKDILDAFSPIEDDFELHIVGDGKDMQITQNYASHLKIYPKIIWHGWQKYPWEQFTDLTAMIMASEHEGFGMSLVEAASRGVYTISSNCPVGPADIIIQGVNGTLFEVGDVNALTNHIKEIINDEVELPEQSLIRASVEKFYPENYYKNFKKSLISIMENWNNR